MARKKQCVHPPDKDSLKAARDLLGSVVVDERNVKWIVDGVRFDAYDCDCASMNYGTEMAVDVSRGPYGDRIRKTLGCLMNEEGFETYGIGEPSEKFKITR